MVGRTFKWAFLPTGQLWSERIAARSNPGWTRFATRHGLQGATVRLGADRFDVEVPRRLQVEQVIVLQQWLEDERDTLDVSQVPRTGASVAATPARLVPAGTLPSAASAPCCSGATVAEF